MASISRLRTQFRPGANLQRLWFSMPFLYPLCLVFLLMPGCMTVSGPVPAPHAHPERPPLHVGDVVETATGNVIGIDELISKLSNASVIYVGEIHTSAQDHEVQLKVLRKLSQGGQCVELGMEMFPVAVQPILDRYLRSEMTEDQFLQVVGWKEIWGFPYQLYRPLIDFQKERHMPVLGLNAAGAVVRKIAHNGLGSLTPEERSQVAREFHLDDPRNRLRIERNLPYTEKTP